MQCRPVATKDKKNSALGVLLEGFGVTVVSLWVSNGTPEAVPFEVEILMAKRFRQEWKGAGESRREQAEAGGGPSKTN